MFWISENKTRFDIIHIVVQLSSFQVTVSINSTGEEVFGTFHVTTDDR